MTVTNHFVMFVFCIVTPFLANAGFEDLFTLGGQGTLPENLVVTDMNALLYKDFSSAPTKIEPLTILWRLTDKKASDSKNPVVKNDGKTYYIVGSLEGDKWGYVETSKATSWMTRFVYAPLPPRDGCVFRVLKKPYTKIDYQKASDKEIEKDTMASIKEVPPGLASFAFILNDESGNAVNQKEQGITIDPNDFKNVMIYNTPITNGATDGKEASAKDLEIGLDIVFVVDTTSSMQPMIDEIVKVCESIAKEVKNAKIVSFGLVEYRDSESGEPGDFGARVVCTLDQKYDTFLNELKNLKATGGGDLPNDVILGLKTAVDGAKWHKNTSKHIILVGNSPNKVTKEAGLISNFKLLYGYTNGGLVGGIKEQAFKRISFHAIVGGNSPVTEIEFSEIAHNNSEGTGYFGNMTKNPKVANELKTMLIDGMKATNKIH